MKEVHPTAMKIYDYINERSVNDIVPTIREICSALSIKSTSTVHRYISELVDAGLIEKSDNQRRAIRLAGKNAMRIPLVGIVTAGEPITAIENVVDYISFYPVKNYNDKLFALNVKGDSMINAGILDGDIVVVEKSDYADNGEIIVALVDGEDATVKTFYKEDGHFRLQPENDTMEPIISDNVSIIGKVVSVMRYY